MELCEGGSVADLIHILHEGLGESEIRILLKEALSGLSYLHSIGKIHRDIKCGNLLLKIDGTVKIGFEFFLSLLSSFLFKILLFSFTFFSFFFFEI